MQLVIWTATERTDVNNVCRLKGHSYILIYFVILAKLYITIAKHQLSCRKRTQSPNYTVYMTLNPVQLTIGRTKI